jgi:hypothetical protein
MSRKGLIIKRLAGVKQKVAVRFFYSYRKQIIPFGTMTKREG